VQHFGLLRTKILILADRQFGHVTRQQLLRLGATSEWITSQIRLGWLIPVHAGVYAVGHVPKHVHAQAKAALLAGGETAALSFAAAAALYQVGEWPATLELSVIGYRRRPGLRIHRPRDLPPHDIRIHLGLRVTSPARTVVDLQRRLTDPRLVRMVNDLRAGGHLGPTAFAELCGRSARVNRLLGDGTFTRSHLEDLFRRFVRRHRLPMPVINATLPETGREVDALYPEARLIIEIDSWAFHGDRAAFERDRAKDAQALALGYRTIRITERRMVSAASAEAALIREILAGRR
jgi:very-short-patch-repair endonuclease